MDRRLFLAGLLGVAGTTAITSVLPRPAHALAAAPQPEGVSQPDLLPNLDVPAGVDEPGGDIELAWHEDRRHRRRRRRRRVRRWRRHCRRYWHGGRRRRRCRRVPYWHWIWIWIG